MPPGTSPPPSLDAADLAAQREGIEFIALNGLGGPRHGASDLVAAA
jgi:hypothetical protein